MTVSKTMMTVAVVSSCYPDDPDLRLDADDFPGVGIYKDAKSARGACEKDSHDAWNENDQLQRWPGMKWKEDPKGTWTAVDPSDGALVQVEVQEVKSWI